MAFFDKAGTTTLWFLVGNGGMDPYDSPLRSPLVGPNNPFPHSLLRTREKTAELRRVLSWGLQGCRVSGMS